MCQYSADDGCANDWHLMHLGMMANSGAALVIVEATHVERHGRITHGCLGLYSDDNEAALARVVAQARRMGTAKFGIQIAHSGRKGSAQRPWEGAGALKPDADPWQTMAASPIPFGDNWHTPREVTEADMERVRAAFVSAVQRALRIGFDEIELHMAHGYLGARLHVADLQQAHRPIWRLVREPPAFPAVDRARGARRGAEARAARRAHHRQRLAEGRPDA